MNFETWKTFFEMGGYGLYVWGSVLVVFVALLLEWLYEWQRHRQVVQSIRESL